MPDPVALARGPMMRTHNCAGGARGGQDAHLPAKDGTDDEEPAPRGVIMRPLWAALPPRADRRAGGLRMYI